MTVFDGESSRSTMPLLDNDIFIKELEKLFFKSRTGGPKKVRITMKRCPGDKGGKDVYVLFRATVGSKKISTQVPPKEVNNFTILYSSVLRESMDNLEKRQKKAEEETSGKAKKNVKAVEKTDSAKGTPTALKK